MALVAIYAVVNISRHSVVLEVIGVISAVATRALKYGIVIRIGMASGAHVVRVAVAGWELCVLCVIEGSAGPSRGVVTILARGREELRLRLVAGIRGVVVVGLVAANAGGWQRRVIVVDVAVGAHPRWRQVRTRQRESRVVVVESGVRPDRRVMAKFARSREASRSMGRIGCAGIILLMARVAQRGVQRIVVIDVAIGALPWRYNVCAG